jgi:hypothetical protein
VGFQLRHASFAKDFSLARYDDKELMENLQKAEKGLL